MKFFHVYADVRMGTREISEKEYFRLFGRRGYLVGRIDGKRVLFNKADSGGMISLSQAQMDVIVKLLLEEASA